MPRELDPIKPPGEDTLDLPDSLGWFVAACTWVREVVLAAGGTPPGARLHALTAIRVDSAGSGPSLTGLLQSADS